MNPWADGLLALTRHGVAALAVLTFILWAGFITRTYLARHAELSEAELLSIASVGWVLPALVVAVLAFACSLLFNAVIGGLTAVVCMVATSLWALRKKPSLTRLWLAGLFFVPVLVLRFAFISEIVLPSYFDPAEHYRLIGILRESYQNASLSAGLLNVFYHLGFHSLVAFLSFFLHIEIVELMLVFGPLLLSVLPFSFYFIVKQETNSTPAALFACLLASFGFHMPGHLMNWGKYPALLGLVAMMFVINLAYLCWRRSFSLKPNIFMGWLAAAVFLSTFIHSRTLVVYGLLMPAFMLLRLQGWRLNLGMALIIVILALESIAVQNDPALKILFSLYTTTDKWMLLFLLPLTVISAVAHPKPTLLLLAWLALCVACMFIPIEIPIHGIQTPLDRPFVQMFSIVPLSLLGGFGLAGVLSWTQSLTLRPGLVRRFVLLLSFGVVLLNASLQYRFYPSECCRFATRDDLAAFAWIDENLPPDATILIASTGLYVTSFDTLEKQSGVDAGIWIPPLLSRPMQPAGQGIQFDLPATHADLCARGIHYIYAGSTPESFNPTQLNQFPAGYQLIFELPLASVYQVKGCKQ